MRALLSSSGIARPHSGKYSGSGVTGLPVAFLWESGAVTGRTCRFSVAASRFADQQRLVSGRQLKRLPEGMRCFRQFLCARHDRAIPMIAWYVKLFFVLSLIIKRGPFYCRGPLFHLHHGISRPFPTTQNDVTNFFVSVFNATTHPRIIAFTSVNTIICNTCFGHDTHNSTNRLTVIFGNFPRKQRLSLP